jgi:hypothetical protein
MIPTGRLSAGGYPRSSTSYNCDLYADARSFGARRLRLWSCRRTKGAESAPAHPRPLESRKLLPFCAVVSRYRRVRRACNAWPSCLPGIRFGVGLRAIARVRHGTHDEMPAAQRLLRKMLFVVHARPQRSGCGPESVRSSLAASTGSPSFSRCASAA